MSPEEEILSSKPSSREDEIKGLVESGRATDKRHARTILAARKLAVELRQRANIDDLTGLYNRRGFLTRAAEQLKVIDRLKTTALLIYFDYDDFKAINDVLGHAVGDRALVEVANLLQETFREIDIIGRIGGDEFAVLAIETEGDEAKRESEIKQDHIEVVTDRLKANIKKRNAKEGHRYQLSLSMGVEHYNSEEPCSIDELLTRADKLMYEQKGKGQE